MATNPKQSDHELFQMLELRDDGYTLGMIARKLCMNRGVVSGCLHRIDHARDPLRVREGTMPYGWWREQLDRKTTCRPQIFGVPNISAPSEPPPKKLLLT